MDKMRFVAGKPERIGGWEQQVDTAMARSPRTLHAWRDNQSIEYIAAGTYKKLYVLTRELRSERHHADRGGGNLTNPFSTTREISGLGLPPAR